MAEGHVEIDARDWARIEVALSAIPQMQADLADMKKRLEKPVAQVCETCPDLREKVRVLWEDRLKVIGWAIGTVGAGGGLGGVVAWIVGQVR
jgi:hypothetical protein